MNIVSIFCLILLLCFKALPASDYKSGLVFADQVKSKNLISSIGDFEGGAGGGPKGDGSGGGGPKNI